MVDDELTTKLFNHLFDEFDVNSDGVIDSVELSAGLSVLCGGTCDDKVAASVTVALIGCY